MKVGIDISQTAYPGTGVARYTQSLARSLIIHNTHNTYSLLFCSLRKKPPEDLIHLAKTPHHIFHYPIPPTLLSKMWNSWHKVPAEWLVDDIDVFISSDWTQPPTKSAKKITIVHDMIPYLFPETSTTSTAFSAKKLQISPNIVKTHKQRLYWVRKECDMIITDSESTKNDIINILSVDESKIHVVYPSVIVPEVHSSEVKRVRTEYSPDKPYILTVGKVEPRKNIERLIKAFVKSKLYTSHRLLIVGAQGWGDTNYTIPASAEDSISFAGFVPEEDLYALYKGAELFIMPSLYEGFGYPALEAMALGCPVATSNTSSLGELVDGYGITFDPEKITEIVSALDTVKKKKSEKLLKKAQKYALSFTEEKFASSVQNLIQTFAK